MLKKMTSKPTTSKTNRRAGSVHTSRTIMVDNLQAVLTYTTNGILNSEELKKAVVDDNLLGKKTERTRLRSWRYLNSTYRLDDPDLAVSGFLKLWEQFPEAQNQLALLRAFPGDPLLQLSAGWMGTLPIGQNVGWPELAEFLKKEGVKYSEKTMGSIARNLLSSWAQVGWLSGKVAKKRLQVTWHPAAITSLLFQEYRQGARGLGLYESKTAKALGLAPEQLDTLASEAGRLGMLNYHRLDDVLEITFPKLVEAP